ncbi:ribonuclease 3-like isoform X3 [Argiope bruennichi]|uniref:ribonuclease 3-like isoform X3 n=1 Tax=Argiope bruennichi TaxID=94029 RepID=UPI0024943480|nr:ribonuclease 3-like isoform X3 [Argiope bruennichi]
MVLPERSSSNSAPNNYPWPSSPVNQAWRYPQNTYPPAPPGPITWNGNTNCNGPWPYMNAPVLLGNGQSTNSLNICSLPTSAVNLGVLPPIFPNPLTSSVIPPRLTYTSNVVVPPSSFSVPPPILRLPPPSVLPPTVLPENSLHSKAALSADSNASSSTSLRKDVNLLSSGATSRYHLKNQTYGDLDFKRCKPVSATGELSSSHIKHKEKSCADLKHKNARYSDSDITSSEEDSKEDNISENHKYNSKDLKRRKIDNILSRNLDSKRLFQTSSDNKKASKYCEKPRERSKSHYSRSPSPVRKHRSESRACSKERRYSRKLSSDRKKSESWDISKRHSSRDRSYSHSRKARSPSTCYSVSDRKRRSYSRDSRSHSRRLSKERPREFYEISSSKHCSSSSSSKTPVAYKKTEVEISKSEFQKTVSKIKDAIKDIAVHSTSILGEKKAIYGDKKEIKKVISVEETRFHSSPKVEKCQISYEVLNAESNISGNHIHDLDRNVLNDDIANDKTDEFHKGDFAQLSCATSDVKINESFTLKNESGISSTDSSTIRKLINSEYKTSTISANDNELKLQQGTFMDSPSKHEKNSPSRAIFVPEDMKEEKGEKHTKSSFKSPVKKHVATDKNSHQIRHSHAKLSNSEDKTIRQSVTRKPSVCPKSPDLSPYHSSSRHSSVSRSREWNCHRSESREREDYKTFKAKYASSSPRFRRESSEINNRHGSRDRFLSHRRPRSREREITPDNQPSLSTEASKWVRSNDSQLYYHRIEKDSKEVVATDALKELHNKFKYELVERAARVRASKPKYDPPIRKTKLRNHKPKELLCEEDSSSSSERSSSSEEEDTSLEELEKKRRHPDRLHPELWFNDPKEMNDGPLCRCSMKASRSGIRHGIYVGEELLSQCDPYSNNAERLYHYKIAMTPVTNFLTKSPTIIMHNEEKYVFEGFSMFSHKPLPKLPNCKVIRFNYEYTILYVEEEMPTNFTVAGLELFSNFLLQEILELVDLEWKAYNDLNGCPQFHFMPRFAKISQEEGKELLSLDVILQYLLNSNKILIDEGKLSEILTYSNKKWQDLADEVKGMIVTCPGMKPSSIRVDQLDREHIDLHSESTFPVIVHFGVRPPQLSYAGNPQYQKAWRDYVKYRHLLANKPKVRYADRHRLMQKETRLQEMRMENDLKRDVTVVISSKGFYKTGIKSDIVQHAMLLPVLVCHLRFHSSLNRLEENIGYKFRDRYLLQLALTHPSYRENFGTNPDHARNSLTNCGLRQPQYGDRRIHYMNTRKRGINTLINIMSRFGSQQEATSSINHNERLEFLGDAVVEFLSSIHLFYMFPDLEEGGLATYRAAIVQNQHLAVLSKKLHLEKFMLYAHGSDLCHDLELRHAMANCFEALMGALFLDGGIEVADKVFSKTLFPEPELQEVWKNYPLHPLQEQEPDGDRKWIESVPLLQKLHKFEEQIGIEFTHIRLLARALTHRSLGYNNLTLGSNQRLEFLGDTVLQLVASEYLYKFFPQHHEGHLSLLRSSLVNNRTQAVVCGDLGMVQYAIYPYFKVELKPKDKADLLEAFLGALYVDKDLGYCRKFCEVCFFPRLQDFIMNQDWNDPKSKLQQCCLTLRSMDGGEPDIPTYKVIECKGPTNTRVYTVAVYFQGNRLAVGSGHSIQQAEMDAASNALQKSKELRFNSGSCAGKQYGLGETSQETSSHN